ncbi:MAG TPA: hypothetical protein DDX51_02920, partial [Clostridiales bacterium]|nr:hypothetical protein [Clostridiales bacterium]
KCFAGPDCVTVPDLPHALEAAGGRDVFLCGGEQVYREGLPLADVLYLTQVHAAPDGDARFPEFDRAAFVETARSREGSCTFVTLRRRAMTYAQARAFAADVSAQKGIVPGLEPMRQLLARLGNPHNRMPFVHIAGTNGKGSTLMLTAALLREAGLRVGTYASPAVFHPRECWQVDGEMISEGEYALWMTRLRAVREAMQAEGQAAPTAFELETAMAFGWMAQRGCDIAVAECGMGGRDDATNVITTTAVSVLTSIGMDHMKFLGGTPAEIARAKGGIIKPGVPVVLQGQDEAVEREIAEICRAQGSALTVVRPEQLRVTQADADSITFDSPWGRAVRVSLPGRVQARNAATALAAVSQLPGIALGEEQMRRALQRVRWPGRLEQLCGHPVILMDGAHNPNAAQRLREELLHRWPDGGLVEIAGVLADKDFTEVGHLVAPLARYIVTVTPDSPRALGAEALADCLRQFCGRVEPAESVEQALRLALREAGEDGVIVAFGSLSWLHSLRRAVEELV